MLGVPISSSGPSLAHLADGTGNMPRMKANEVIRIGRKRNRAASAAASIRLFPDNICWRANSTIKIAFLQGRTQEREF
jgi:hypothetical protein